jgi:hypothetical protein
MKITFQQVKNYVLKNCIYLNTHLVSEIIDSTESFVMDYIECPVGYTETDNLNDINDLVKLIELSFYEIEFEPDGRRRRGLTNHIVKKERKRWIEGHNAGFYGRHIGRLAHLLNNSTPIKQNNIIN